MTEQALRLVDDDGVIQDGDDGSHVDAAPIPTKALTGEDRLRAELAEVKVQLQGAERDIRAWRARCNFLETDKEEKARKDKLWPRAEKLFEEWQRLCRHPRSKWDYTRFEVVRPYLRSDGYDLCLLAIQGAAFDPYTKARENGSVKRFDDWELIFKNRGKFEEFCSRAPVDALKAYREKTELAAAQADEKEESDGDDA